ncbi:hypothetical protein [Clavibacter michiganensis]|uniref:hypothetical protein n=1 Tax=Clavibacter michiganensis TaxID=28447 RepID=UPI0026DD3CF7|nr:hypothetical protein [Clavibacter michiganensis]MDO4070543.1 hypothetical protein [Clavibacter michiganensis]
MSTITTFATLDSRKRLNLAALATRESYRVTREDNGRIILDPAVILSEDELAALSDPVTIAAIAASDTDPGHRPRIPLN